MKTIFTTPIDDFRTIKGELIRIDKIGGDEPVYGYELASALNKYNPHKAAYNRGVTHGLLYAAALLIFIVLLWITRVGG
jgi:hypothetical protein